MRIFNKIIVFFYTLIFLFIGVSLIFIAFHLAGRIDLSDLFDYVIGFSNLHWILFLSGSLLILVTLSLASISFKKFQAGKTIGYSTSAGQVIISLGAIEDFIRRLTQQLPEVKELRSEVFVTRRGIEIESRVVLWTTSSIPDVTEKVQAMIKTQVQELLSGIEKPVMVNVLVTKISQRDQDKNVKNKQDIPFLR
ncbi:MAG: alkaline shock response membrane anchor protein AmaP [Candidatus Omnitrophica bacterium]|nr:alkaline shock response membrane anchor protein AmaP [Candidatus Omnitrophota bacterium]MBU4478343.1 alkaline shock response membrane anchor protein AmaP [Candidatus Omnitrophota bacterium]MCG2704263.1 alkaline shock response membrane anchor protein AmaP [Candidatus Omnitrophota bacterium]